MAVNRFVFSFVVVVYLVCLGPRGFAPCLAAMNGYAAVSLLLLLHLRIGRGAGRVRRVLCVAADMGVIGALLLLGGSTMTAVYSIYLWVILGNGFRFGLRFLALSTGLAAASFAFAVWRSPFWHGQTALSVGLLLGLVTVPLYGAVLIRRLSAARQEAEQANRTKSLFLANVSHSVRTPLNAIVGSLALLDTTPLDPDQRDLAAKLRIGCDVLTLLLGSVLDFTRIEARRMPVRLAPLCPAALAGELATLFRQQAEEKGLRLFLRLGATLPATVVSDRHHLTEMLVNLLGNALKFTERGEVMLSVDLSDGPTLRLEVADTGIGLAPDARSRIFESFTQADETILDRFGGTGLGLAIVRGLSGMLGGTVSVDGEAGRGSRFTVTLPVTVPAEPAVAAAEPRLAFPAGCLLHAPSRAVAVLPERLREAGIASAEVPGGVALHDALARLAAQTQPDGLLVLDLAEPAELDALAATLDRADPFGRVFRLALLPGPEHGHLSMLLSRSVTTVLYGADTPDVLRAALDRFAATVPAAAAERVAERAGDPPSGAADPAPAPAGPGRRLSILVADDNATNRHLMEKILSAAGHGVELVRNGEEAVIALTERPFDLALFDLNMPVMNGLEAAKEYAFLALGTEPVPIAALTADATPDAARRCREAGMVDCINKPVTPAALLERIARLVPGAATSLAAAPPPPPPPNGAVSDIRSHPGFRPASEFDPQTLGDLRRLGGDAFVLGMAQAFLQDAEPLQEQIAAAIVAGDLFEFRNAVHALRSAAANIGATEIVRLCGLCRDLPAEALPAAGRRLSDRLRDLIARLHDDPALRSAAARARADEAETEPADGSGAMDGTAATGFAAPPLRPFQDT